MPHYKCQLFKGFNHTNAEIFKNKEGNAQKMSYVTCTPWDKI